MDKALDMYNTSGMGVLGTRNPVKTLILQFKAKVTCKNGQVQEKHFAENSKKNHHSRPAKVLGSSLILSTSDFIHRNLVGMLLVKL